MSPINDISTVMEFCRLLKRPIAGTPGRGVMPNMLLKVSDAAWIDALLSRSFIFIYAGL